ncbi:MAG: heme biosynthesis HemY N-terminal domain-containing protein [Castellaniella sp.]
MRAWFWTLLVFIAAVGAALLLQDHGGNILILVQPWRIEISLTLALILLVTAFVLLYAVLRLLAWLARGPGRLRSWQGRRAQRRDYNLLENAWIHLLEGRLEPADKDLTRLLGKSSSRTSKVLAALASARAAYQRGDAERGERALAQARELMRDDARLRDVVAIVTAELYLDGQRAGEALALLQPVQDASSRHFHATRLLLRAHVQLGNHERVHALARLLLRRGAIDEAQAMQLIEQAVAAQLRAAGAEGFRALWNGLKGDERNLPEIALAAAEVQANANQHEEAGRILENAIAKTMDVRLIQAYGQCPADQVRRRLNKAESWLKSQGDNPILLATMGRLCLTGELWGLAERYLLESMRLRSDVRIHALLGNLYDAQGRAAQATHHWRLASRVAGRLPVSGDAQAPLSQIPGRDALLVPLTADSAAAPETPPISARASVLPAAATETAPETAPGDTGKADDTAGTASGTDAEAYFDTAPIPGVDVSQTSDRPRSAHEPS